MIVVEHVLAAERGPGGKVVGLGEGGDVARRLDAPPSAADDHQGPFGRPQQGAHLIELPRRRRGADDLVGRRIGDGAFLAQHIFGQDQDDRAGAAGNGQVEGVADVFRDAVGTFDLGHPLGHLAEDAAEVHFLKRLAVLLIARHLADEQHHRR